MRFAAVRRNPKRNQDAGRAGVPNWGRWDCASFAAAKHSPPRGLHSQAQALSDHSHYSHYSSGERLQFPCHFIASSLLAPVHPLFSFRMKHIPKAPPSPAYISEALCEDARRKSPRLLPQTLQRRPEAPPRLLPLSPWLRPRPGIPPPPRRPRLALARTQELLRRRLVRRLQPRSPLRRSPRPAWVEPSKPLRRRTPQKWRRASATSTHHAQ